MFWTSRIHTARKNHHCELCGQLIPTGTKYQKEVGYYDDFFSRSMHIRCANFEEDYFQNVDSEFFWDDIIYYIYEKNCNSNCASYDVDSDDCSIACSIFNCPKLTSEYGDPVEDN